MKLTACICGEKKEPGRMRCGNCQADVQAAYETLEKERAAEEAASESWLPGGIAYYNCRLSSAETEPIRPPSRLYRQKKTRRIEQGD